MTKMVTIIIRSTSTLNAITISHKVKPGRKDGFPCKHNNEGTQYNSCYSKKMKWASNSFYDSVNPYAELIHIATFNLPYITKLIGLKFEWHIDNSQNHPNKNSHFRLLMVIGCSSPQIRGTL